MKRENNRTHISIQPEVNRITRSMIERCVDREAARYYFLDLILEQEHRLLHLIVEDNLRNFNRRQKNKR